MEWKEQGYLEVEGLFCVVQDLSDTLGARRVLFGKDTGFGREGCSVVAMNDITPFDSNEDAVRALQLLKERSNAGEVELVKIKIKIGLSPSEWASMSREGPYAVVWRRENNCLTIVGSYVEGRPGTSATIPGADIQDNDLTPIPTFERAMYIREEVGRQGRGVGRGAYLATFQCCKVRNL
ncbi:MAG: hypothetical protein HYU80_00365 [Candidatus Blackburnbacteria bacterium]|nr:hypothetical protein [Candidatus Blackburnbacteria bacterium]